MLLAAPGAACAGIIQLPMRQYGPSTPAQAHMLESLGQGIYQGGIYQLVYTKVYIEVLATRLRILLLAIFIEAIASSAIRRG